jgi:hypothetical protein
MSAMLLIAKIAKARKADRDLSMVISIIRMSNVIECGSNRPNALNAEPESFQPVFAEMGKWFVLISSEPVPRSRFTSP